MNVDLAALADFVDATITANPEFAEPEFAFTFNDQRIYVEQKAHHYNFHIDNEIYQMPRI
ncbi:MULTISPECIES: hypothetical protein [Sphingobium]|uniref:hypothetical protein n=1 Tax=Sphingobium TaxID=165695 RepID=UPI0007F4D372|nr:MULTISPECIES: hypothetical protein [Sphingobium]OAN51837.1 hypothetical protein A7Q26_09085 [Sphingobium sp. TCM1]QWT15303.1 hypothetical protein GTV57_06070 [Sphingobium xenophagum]